MKQSRIITPDGSNVELLSGPSVKASSLNVRINYYAIVNVIEECIILNEKKQYSKISVKARSAETGELILTEGYVPSRFLHSIT